jgi:hypothetical protein
MYQEAAPSLVNVNWRAVVIVGNSKTIYARATQISKNALTLLLPVQLAMHIPAGNSQQSERRQAVSGL